MGTHFRNSAIMKVIFPLLLIVLTSMYVSNGQVTFVRDPGTWTLKGGRYLDCSGDKDDPCKLVCPSSRKLKVRRRTSTRIDLSCYLHPTLYPAAGIPQEVHLMMKPDFWEVSTGTPFDKTDVCTADQCLLPCAGTLKILKDTTTTKRIVEIECKK